MIPFLILHHEGDRAALHVGASLRRRHGPTAVRLVSSGQLEMAPRWRHSVDDTATTTRVRLGDCTEIDSENIGVVFNRLLWTQARHFQASSKDDHNYAAMELYALWMSWLESLPCPVMNAPSVRGLGTQRRGHAEWMVVAGKAGFATPTYRFTTDPRRFGANSMAPHRRVLQPAGSVRFESIPAHTVGRQPCAYIEPVAPERSRVLVAGDNFAGPLAGRFQVALNHLRDAVGLDLFEVEMARPADAERQPEWLLTAVDPFPQFEDQQCVDACVAMLEAAVGLGSAQS